jgi:hypothetical protein
MARQHAALSDENPTLWGAGCMRFRRTEGRMVSYGYPVREPIGQVQEVFSSAVPLTMVTVIAARPWMLR